MWAREQVLHIQKFNCQFKDPMGQMCFPIPLKLVTGMHLVRVFIAKWSFAVNPVHHTSAHTNGGYQLHIRSFAESCSPQIIFWLVHNPETLKMFSQQHLIPVIMNIHVNMHGMFFCEYPYWLNLFLCNHQLNHHISKFVVVFHLQIVV